MKLNVGLVSTSAGKTPNDKQVKKAAKILKAANKAKTDALREKLQAVIDQALALHKESIDTHAVFEAQIGKLSGQIKRLEAKRDTAENKVDGRIAKLIPRITKLQDEYHLAGGKDIVPKELAEYFTKPAKKSANDDSAKVKKAKRPTAK